MTPHHLKTSLLSSLLMLLLPALALARTWRVEPDGSGDATGVQRGIDLASAGDTVLVGPGTYYEDIDFLGKDIVLKSLLGPEVTILDGTGQDSSIVIFKSGETRAAVLEGFLITHGRGTAFLGGPTEGGAIFCPAGSPSIVRNTFAGNHAVWGGAVFLGAQLSFDGPFPAPLLEENTFTLNTAESGGGAITASQSNSVVRGNFFQGNEVLMVGDGGGIHLRLTYGSTAIVENNTFVGNSAGDQGGGIYVYTDYRSGPAVIQQNFVYKNVARGLSSSVSLSGAGGGIATDSLKGLIRQNTIVENSALPEGLNSGGGLRIRYPSPDLDVSYNIIAYNTSGGLVCRLDGNASLGPNILWQNAGFDVDPYGCPGAWAAVVIIIDPYFCSPSTGNFQLAVNSPALSGGDIMGAFSVPGCGPVAVRAITWGSLKALYH